jgi:hypothetical protein
MSALERRRETRAEREHRHDREAVAAIYRRKRAKAGLGYKFRAPKRLRR